MGSYPERALVDKIDRNRKNSLGARNVVSPSQGRALADHLKIEVLTREQRRQEYTDICERSVIEGVFGTTKTAYGMDPVMTRLEETTRTVIVLSILAFNLKKLLKVSLRLFSKALSGVLRKLYSQMVAMRRLAPSAAVLR